MKKKLFVIITVLVLLVSMANFPVVSAESDLNSGPVAMIGEKSYTSIQSAFDAVLENQTATVIKILKNFVMSTSDIATLSVNKNVVLDLDGKNITVNSDFSGRPIINLGTLEVIGNGKIDSSNSKNGFGAINNSGNLTIQDGTYSGNVLGGGSAIRNTAGKLIINGGRFEQATCAIYNDINATCIINGGVFDNRTCSSCDKVNWSYCIRSFGDLTVNSATVYGVQGALAIAAGTAVVNDGHFETLACDKHGSGTAYYSLYIAGERGKTFATINGGNFISISKTAALIGNDNDGGEKLPAKCVINDGNFTTNGPEKILVIQGANISGDPSILGGTYCKEVKNEYLKDGYKQIQNANRSYTVVPKVTDVKLDLTSVTLEVGKSTSLNATSVPVGAVDPMSWSSKDTSIATVDKNGKVTAEKVGKTTITAKAGDVSKTCEIIVYQQQVVEPPKVDIDKPVNEVTVGINDKESNQTINSTVNEILNGNAGNLVSSDTLTKIEDAVQAGKAITTTIISETVNVNTLEKDVVDSFKAEAKKIASKNEKVVIAQYLDLSIGLMAGTEKLGEVNQLTDKIQFTIAMPKDFVKKGRTYYILRMHDGEVTKLPVETKGNILKFETDQFSTYALVYVEDIDVPDIDVPDIDGTPDVPSKPVIPHTDKPIVQTNDMSDVRSWLAVITLSFVGLIILSKKNRYNR